MVFRCSKGTTRGFRYKKTKSGRVRLGGCMKRGRFVSIKEAKKR